MRIVAVLVEESAKAESFLKLLMEDARKIFSKQMLTDILINLEANQKQPQTYIFESWGREFISKSFFVNIEQLRVVVKANDLFTPH